MKNVMYGLGAAAALALGTPAYASVTCEPGGADNNGVCTDNATSLPTTTATFAVTPVGVGPGYTGDISATITHNPIAKGSFSDTFNFLLPYSGTGGGNVTSFAASLASDLDFTRVILNGVIIASKFAADVALGAIQINNGVSEFVTTNNVALNGGPNSLVIEGISKGARSSYSGALSFTTSVPETATWIMMILGFGAAGSMLRYRRRSTKVSFA